MGILEGAVLGFAVGVFCPAIARKVKAAFVKEGDAVKAKLPVTIADQLAKKL